MSERQPSSRNCFVCGRDNPLGLRTRWESDRVRGEARCTVTVPAAFNSYPGIVHGGVVTALLDEAMGRTPLVEGGFEDLMVTGRIEVAFRQPTPTGVPITVVARVTRKTSSRAQAEAEVLLPDGSVAARAKALLLPMPPGVGDAWAEERAAWRVDED